MHEILVHETKSETNLRKCFLENEIEITKRQLEKLIKQRKKWRGHNKNALYWSFICVNDNKKIDNKCHQMTRCFLYYPKPIEACNKKNKEKERFNILLQKKWNNFLEKPCGVDQSVVLYKKKLKKRSTIF